MNSCIYIILTIFFVVNIEAFESKDIRVNLAWLHALRNNIIESSTNYTSSEPTVSSTVEPSSSIPSLSPTVKGTTEPSITTFAPSYISSPAPSNEPSWNPTQGTVAYLRINSYRDVNCTTVKEIIYLALGQCIPGLSPPALRVTRDGSSGGIILTKFADSQCTVTDETSPIPSSYLHTCDPTGRSVLSVESLSSIPTPPFAAFTYLDIR